MESLTLCSGAASASPFRLLDDLHLVEQCAAILCLAFYPADRLIADGGDRSHGLGFPTRVSVGVHGLLDQK